jgi:hypothetical protein
MHTAKMSKSGMDEQAKRRNWVSPLASNAMFAGQEAFARAGFANPALVTNWDAIAGPETARLARPLRLSRGAHGGVLTLLAEPGAAIFLQHETRALCDRINTFLGTTAVVRLKFVQGTLTQRKVPPAPRAAPGPLPPGDPATRYAGPEGLREALWRLARARRTRG